MTTEELASELDILAEHNAESALLREASHALRRLGTEVATLTHRAEVAERSCEDAKRREQEASAKMQAMAQSESNKALRARAEAAERELAEVHRGVESVALHNARAARDAATARAWDAEQSLAGHVSLETLVHDDDACRCLACRLSNAMDDRDAALSSAALWRERCNRAEERAGTWMWQRTEMLHSLRRARFLSAGWRRLARHYQSCHLAGHACLRETHRAKGEAAAARDAAIANAEAVLSTAEAMRVERDDLRAKLARAEGVVQLAKGLDVRHHCGWARMEQDTCTCGLDALRAALATYEEG